MPSVKDVPYWQYLRKSILWMVGNAFVGLIPILYIAFVYGVSEGKAGEEVMNRLIHDGAILFVCFAVMGSVLVDFVLSGLTMKVSLAYVLMIIPSFVIILLLTDYSLIMLKVIDDSCFSIDSFTSIIVIVLTVVFSIFTKASLYILEDSRHE